MFRVETTCQSSLYTCATCAGYRYTGLELVKIVERAPHSPNSQSRCAPQKTECKQQVRSVPIPIPFGNMYSLVPGTPELVLIYPNILRQYSFVRRFFFLGPSFCSVPSSSRWRRSFSTCCCCCRCTFCTFCCSLVARLCCRCLFCCRPLVKNSSANV